MKKIHFISNIGHIVTIRVKNVNKFSKKTIKKKNKKKDIDKDLVQLESSIDKIIKLPEFTMVDELARSMDVTAQDVIKVCMGLGLMVTINQRLDLDTMIMVADEFEYEIESIEEKERFDSALRRKQLSLVLAGRMKPEDANELKSALFPNV